MKTTTYTPEPALRNPRRLFREMLTDLAASRELAWQLTRRNISAQYRQTFLGYFWAFFPPIAFTATFLLLRNGGVFNPGDTGVPAVVFMLVGTTLWQTFAEAVQAPLKVVGQSTQMLIKINFPREALILAGLGQCLFNFAIRTLILLAVFIWFRIVPDWRLLLFPLGVLALVGSGLTVGILLTPLGVLYKDIQQALGLIMTFWMFLSGVINVPPTAGTIGQLTRLNPVTCLIQVSRDWFLGMPTQFLEPFLIVNAATLVLLLIGWILYRVSLPHLIARLGG